MELLWLLLGYLLLRSVIQFWMSPRLNWWQRLFISALIVVAIGYANYWQVDSYKRELDDQLSKFDLDGDGVFSGKEISKEYERVMALATNDAGRNFSLYYIPMIAAFFEIIFQVASTIRHRWSIRK
jgi:hypothetical protein